MHCLRVNVDEADIGSPVPFKTTVVPPLIIPELGVNSEI